MAELSEVSVGQEKPKIGFISLIFSSIASVIGSGWLFAPYYASQKSGAGSLLAWVLGALLAFMLSFFLSELVGLFPKRGAFTRFVSISHGGDQGFLFALANWMGMLAVIPTEAVASVRYLSSISPTRLEPLLYSSNHLSLVGLGASIGIMFFYFLFNFWGIKLFIKINNSIAVIKIVVPLLTAVMILYSTFHHSNFTAVDHKWIPYGASSIFATIMGSGILYAFNGFQIPLSFANEAKNPKRNIPWAMILSISFCLLLYLLLQVAFIGALPADQLKSGWHGIQYHAPFIELAELLGFHIIIMALYADACISPSGTGLAYMGATGRMLYAMAKQNQAPQYLAILHPVYHFSRRALVCNFLLAILFLFVFRSWQSLVSILSVFHLISYWTAPIAVCGLRQSLPNETRLFKLPLAGLIGPMCFCLLGVIYTASGAEVAVEMSLLANLFFIAYLAFTSSCQEMFMRWKKSCTMYIYLLYLAGLTLLNVSYGGYDYLPDNIFYILVVIGSYFVYKNMARHALPIVEREQ